VATLFTELQDLLSRYRFPPNFEVSIERPYDRDEFVLLIRASWSDIYHEDQTVTTYSQQPILNVTAEAMIKNSALLDVVLYGNLKELWEHELKEWFAFDGKQVYDLHPKGKNGPLE
jgi:hypothetical protein